MGGRADEMNTKGRLDKVPFNFEDTSAQITELLESCRAQVEGAIGALVAGALVDDTGFDRLGLVVLERDTDAPVAGGVAPRLGAHHEG